MQTERLKFSFILILFINIGCNRMPNNVNDLDVFSPPQIIDSLPKTSTLKEVNSIRLSNYPVVSVFPFSRICKLYESNYNPWDTIYKRNGTLKTDGFQFLIDTTQKITIENDTLYSDDYLFKKDTNRFSVGYPCFIYNETKETKWFHCQDGSIVATQEVLDSNYIWRPIQIWSFPWCGNSNYKMPIPPSHFLLFKIPLYKGGFYTQIRLRIYYRNGLYLTDYYNGWINYKQINMPKEYLDDNNKLRSIYDFLNLE